MIKPSLKIDKDEYLYLDLDYQLDLPQLILAVSPYYQKYRFAPKYEWMKIAHQTAGIACHQHYLLGLRLTPRPKVMPRLKDLADIWLDSNAGAFGVSFDELTRYREQLQATLGVDCD